MNGPQHYAQAESLLESADSWKAEEGDQAAADYCVRIAMVHATLANAAAVAEEVTPNTAKAWAEVLDS